MKEALFIVDNADKSWNALQYLSEWCEISDQFDIATGYFDISSLIKMDGQWQKVDKIRILMGDEVSLRSRDVFVQALGKIKNYLNGSIETEKEENDFLKGVDAIVNAIRTKKIECKVYKKKKFHAKAYITYSKFKVAPPVALVGSSNFTYSGLTKNLELNVQLTGTAEVNILQEWYEKHWNEAEDVTEDLLKVIEKHLHEYTPFEVYAKALHEFHRGHQITSTEWEQNESVLYAEISQYQKEAYHALMKIADQWGGAFLCDGVGLGKTFVGLMVLERLVVHERKRVVLLVPKSGRIAVWEENIKVFLPRLLNNPYVTFTVYNHTDLIRGKTNDRDWPAEFEHIQAEADAIIIDEGHNFRNHTSSRYKKLFEVMKNGKRLFLLTATPINNSLLDLKHQIELFTQRNESHFSLAPLGIHSLTGHIRIKEAEILKNIIADDSEEILSEFTSDKLFQSIVVQRSRKYVLNSLKLENSTKKVIFPTREDPQVANYSLEAVYGPLLKKVEKAFNSKRPLLRLPVYSLYDKNPITDEFIYYIGDPKKVDPMTIGRNVQVVALIRVLFLKRLESSVVAFKTTCENLLFKLFSFIEKYNKRQAERWKNQHYDLIEKTFKDRSGEESSEEDEDTDLPEDLRFDWDIDEKLFNVQEIITDLLLDLDQLALFLEDLKDFDYTKDEKINKLVELLNTDIDLKREKVIIFSEFMSTTKYIKETLKEKGFTELQEINSEYKGDRLKVIKQFSPFYNKTSSAELKETGQKEIRILVATDVLSEGLNLQDARLMINYDLHWNPVRLMQRIGRVDRRMDPTIEELINLQHPDLKDKRGVVRFWNFLPPNELNRILSLYNKVTNKTLRISKVFGIEGKKLITPDDDYDALKDFNHAYEGDTTPIEEMNLAYQSMLTNNPGLKEQLDSMPLKMFSGKERLNPDARGLFFCYLLPVYNISGENKGWSIKDGKAYWYYYFISTETIIEDALAIDPLVKCEKATLRKVSGKNAELSEIRRKMFKYIFNTYMKKNQVPINDDKGNSLTPVLLAWMEEI